MYINPVVWLFTLGAGGFFRGSGALPCGTDIPSVHDLLNYLLIGVRADTAAR